MTQPVWIRDDTRTQLMAFGYSPNEGEEASIGFVILEKGSYLTHEMNYRDWLDMVESINEMISPE